MPFKRRLPQQGDGLSGCSFFRPLLVILLLLSLGGCASNVIGPIDVRMLDYHADICLNSVEELTARLYPKNPKYEPDKAARQEKIDRIFHGEQPIGEFAGISSHELLTASFSLETEYQDRVYLLGLGLAKSIREAYGVDERTFFFSGLQIPLERLERLHHNISQVNWRMKTYRDEAGDLLFLTNEAGEDGYINMGYEVIMTEIMTRVSDDIYLRGGLPGKYLFNMSTMFMSILL